MLVVEQASLLKVNGLIEDFCPLAKFNNVVLAAEEMEYG